jgi:hypothetical protein
MQRFIDDLNRIQREQMLRLEHEKTLALLRALTLGDVTLDQVKFADGSWTVVQTVIEQPEENEGKYQALRSLAVKDYLGKLVADSEERIARAEATNGDGAADTDK